MKRKYKLPLAFILAVSLSGFLMQFLINPLLDGSRRHRAPPEFFTFTEHSDNNKSRSQEEHDKNLQRLPKIYLEGTTYHKQFNKTCRKFPSLGDIHFSNSYWQVFRASDSTDVQVLSAFFDDRRLNDGKQSIRIVAMINKADVSLTAHCQLWYETEGDAVVVKMSDHQMMWLKAWGVTGDYMPYLLTCDMPRSHYGKVPLSVSLVNKPCDYAKNNLAVMHDRPKEKENFAVCVKGLDFLDVDLSLRLIEWIELLTIFGVDKIVIYKLEVHPNVDAVLAYYERIGKVVTITANLPGYHANIPELRHKILQNVLLKRYFEVALYNDCFYTNMYKYKYVSLLDTDEIIVPLRATTWSDMLKAVRESANDPDVTSYIFQNIYYLDVFRNESLAKRMKQIPDYTYMLRHVYRTELYTPKDFYIKCLHDTEKILILHNHFPLKCLGDCKKADVDVTLGHLQHYRRDCYKSSTNCKKLKENVVFDDNLWRFKDELIGRMDYVINKLQ